MERLFEFSSLVMGDLSGASIERYPVSQEFLCHIVGAAVLEHDRIVLDGT